MGSFTELTLAFTFAVETPIETIGAFAEWRVPNEPWQTGETAPELPTLEASIGEDSFDAYAHLAGFFDENPMQDPYGGRWPLTTRTLRKESPDWVQYMVAPLGRWSAEGSTERPWFAGYILDE